MGKFEADGIEQAMGIAADKASDETIWLVASLEVREA
jgi:hypothetical protein